MIRKGGHVARQLVLSSDFQRLLDKCRTAVPIRASALDEGVEFEAEDGERFRCDIWGSHWTPPVGRVRYVDGNPADARVQAIAARTFDASLGPDVITRLRTEAAALRFAAQAREAIRVLGDERVRTLVDEVICRLVMEN